MIGSNVENCTGCGACVQACPKSCVQWNDAELGFAYPVADAERCVRCGLCLKVCPIDADFAKPQYQKAYAVVCKNSDALKKSASGGAFSAIASWVLSRGGVVYGCAYDENLKPTQIRVDNEDELSRLRGSKYVQSDSAQTFRTARQDLDDGKYVLYSGTPCLIAGLKTYLGREYDKLICVDLVCHGVPSARYFLDYVRYLEEKSNAKIDAFRFRDKECKNWGLSGTYSGTYLNTGKRFRKRLYYFASHYYAYFLRCETYRASCYSCKYANADRLGDFTLGDLWGAEGMKLPFSVENGCSLTLVNTEKARVVFNELDVVWREVSFEQAVQNNRQLSEPSRRPESRDARAKEYESESQKQIARIFIRTRRKFRLIGRLKYSVPASIKRLLLKLRYSKYTRFT